MKNGYVLCQLVLNTYTNKGDYIYVRHTDIIKRKDLVRILYKYALCDYLMPDMSRKKLHCADEKVYCVMKCHDGNIGFANLNALKEEVSRFDPSVYSTWTLKEKTIKTATFRKGPVPYTGKKKNSGHGCPYSGTLHTCQVNTDFDYRRLFYTPKFRIMAIRRFDWEPPPRCYKVDKCWKKQYKVKKQYMKHIKRR